MYYIPGQEKILSRLKKKDVIQIIFSNQNKTKLEISSGRNTGKPTNAQKLNNTILIKLVKEIMKEVRKYLTKDKNGNTMYKNLQDAVKAVLRGKFIVINAYNYQEERSQINNLTLHHKKQEDQTKPKPS